MARKIEGEKAPRPPKKERFNDVKFVNYELTDEERKTLKAMPVWSADWDNWLDRAEDSGYRITLRFDDYSRSFAAFMSCTDEKDDNFGAILTGRGSTGIKALRQVLYKHWALSDGAWNHLDRGLNQEIDD